MYSQMVEEESTREQVEDILNNGEPIKEETNEAIDEEIGAEIPKPKSKPESKAKAKPEIKTTKEPVEPVGAVQKMKKNR